jgi:hypothetical protein
MEVNYHHFVLSNQRFNGMTDDMSGVHSWQQKLHFVPDRADEPSFSINYIHTKKNVL